MRVELGAGTTAQDGWLAVDVNPTHADLIADATVLPFHVGTVTELRAVDVLEHLSYRDTDRALAEWARICAPGATVYVQVPDAETILQWFVNDPERLERWERGQRCTALHGAQWRLLGGHADGTYVDQDGDWRWNAHYSLWSTDTLRSALLRVGFEVVRMEVNGHPNVCCTARRI